VIDAVPNFPSLVAVIVADPDATAVTTPALETVATVALVVAHATGRLVTVVPLASLTVAVSVAVCPAGMVAVLGWTMTLATPAVVTVAVALADLPSLVATMFDVPGATPVMTPVADTVATLVLLDVKVTCRPVRTNPS
jgi:hypothetical protein